LALRLKVFLILLIIVILSSFTNYIILNKTVFPGFLTLEHDEANKDIVRVLEAIQREVHHLDSLLHDWSAWNDTYDFIQDRNSSYIDDNLVVSSFTDNELNIIYLLDNKGNLIWGEIRDLESEELIQISEFSDEVLTATHPLLSYKTNAEDLGEVKVSGIYLTSQGPLIISSRPILTSENKGPVKGTLIMGRFINEGFVKILQTQTRVNCRIWVSNNKSIPLRDRNSFAKISKDAPFPIEERDHKLLQIYTTYPDISGNPALLIKADIPRHISSKGRAITNYANISILIVGLIVLVILSLSIQKMVLGPIGKLTRHVFNVGKSDDLSQQISMKSRDEIGKLGKEFNMMVEKLADARNRLLEQSYHSGLAEISSGILHNIRNILTPLNGYISVIQKKFNNVQVENIKKAIEELQTSNPGSDREQSLNRYLQLANGQFLSLLEETEDQLGKMSNQSSEIENILSEYDKYSHAKRAIEALELAEVLTEAHNLIPQDLKDSVSLEIDPSVTQLPEILAERVVLTHVITNLISNAVESILKTDKRPGKIRVEGIVEKEDDKKWVHAKFIDNGIGIDKKTMERIFERGFSTKKTKQEGFGLHWCGNAMTSMNSRLYAESDGSGKGACFHIVFPVPAQ
jgi:two-component system, NtrC family, sensor kinase